MEYPEILTLNPMELIEWCKTRRKELGISKAKLAEMSNVPESTIDRIFSGKNPEFRYSSIQPLISVLLQYNEKLPEPDLSDETQPEYYYKTIEGYKLVVENKNHIIAEGKRAYDRMKKELTFLKEENAKKDAMIDAFQSHIKWMEGMIDDKRTL